MRIIEIAPSHAPSDPTLSERFFRMRLVGRTTEFLALVDEEEAGLLVFEHWPNSSLGIVHEIVVLERFVKRGLGTMLLTQAHAYAVKSGITRLQLTPRRVGFGHLNDEELSRWYGRHGFNLLPGSQTDMSKEL